MKAFLSFTQIHSTSSEMKINFFYPRANFINYKSDYLFNILIRKYKKKATENENVSNTKRTKLEDRRIYIISENAWIFN